MRKIKFWFEGRGGMRSESLIKTFPFNISDSDIKEELDYWVESLESSSEYQRFGWSEVD